MRLLTTIALALTITTIAQAQSIPRPVALGDTVRVVLSDGAALHARFGGMSTSTVTLLGPLSSPTSTEMSWAEIKRLEMLMGRRTFSQAAMASGTRGALAGGIIGVGLGALLVASGGGSDLDGFIPLTMITTSTGFAAGTVIGGAIALTRKAPMWVPVERPVR